MRRRFTMGTGEIRDFTKPNSNPPVEGTQQPQEIQRLSGSQGVARGVEVRKHETVTVESDKYRSTVRRPGEPEIRVRDGDPKQWEEVKRNDAD